MRLWRTTALLALISRSAQLIAKDGTDTPMCAIHCWNNSKYVSSCIDDDSCLCNETGYQKAIFQCIYAQCDSLLFGPAFLHTITRCAEIGIDLHMATPPPLMDHDELRRREANYVAGLTSTYGSVSDGGYSTQGIPVSPTNSASSYPTQSVGNGYNSTTSSATREPPLATEGIPHSNNVTIPTITSATAHVSSSQGLGVSATTTGPLVYTGIGFHFGRSSIGTILIASVTLYLTI